jgi:hypothetical protein
MIKMIMNISDDVFGTSPQECVGNACASTEDRLADRPAEVAKASPLVGDDATSSHAEKMAKRPKSYADVVRV